MYVLTWQFAILSGDDGHGFGYGYVICMSSHGSLPSCLVRIDMVFVRFDVCFLAV